MSQLGHNVARNVSVEEIGSRGDTLRGGLLGDLFRRIDTLHTHAGIAKVTKQTAVITAKFHHEIVDVKVGTGDDRFTQLVEMFDQTERNRSSIQVVAINKTRINNMNKLNEAAILAKIVVQRRDYTGEPPAHLVDLGSHVRRNDRYLR